MTRNELAHVVTRTYAEGGYTYQSLADMYEVTRNKIAGMIRDARKWREAQDAETQTAHAESISANDGAQAGVVVDELYTNDGAGQTAPFSSYVFRRVNFEQYAIPRYTGHERLTGAWIIISDVHLPFTDWDLAYRVVDVAKKTRICQLLIVGDWVNFDTFSHYDPVVPGVPLTVEMKASIHLAEYYGSWFSHIVMVMGNHEQRLMKATKAQIDHTALGRLLSSMDGKLEMSPYTYADIECDGQVWHATHARNYSRIKGRVADELAQKHQKHIILAHQHHSGKILDRYGRYVCVDVGGLHEQEFMAYAQINDSTAPNMTKGFVVLMGGVGELLTPYPAYTDWTHWLPEEARNVLPHAA